MTAPDRAHVRARDCALAAQWPATSGRNMLLFRASCCATGCRDFTLGCAPRWPLSRETIARPMAAYRALIARMVACWLARFCALFVQSPRRWTPDVARGRASRMARRCAAAARDLLAAAAAVRPPSGESLASFRRLIFLLGLVRACPGQPMKFSGRYSISGLFWSILKF
ncbi:hypothetical protein F511_15404 [Dorcoceras hygrometricum]|uniref:Uncharacterized protein n=1 Tax=Dorcoceras hygrometricum TaxID=472368 RepID=A0A2Z7D4F6_9LAMI|nr:hypothetical protein F511_15404 [Dorcoceras hygrometricum]